MAKDNDKPQPVDPNTPDPELADVCARAGHDYDENGVCKDCGSS